MSGHGTQPVLKTSQGGAGPTGGARPRRPPESAHNPAGTGASSMPSDGKSLISRTVELVNQINTIDEVIIFASNNQFSSYLEDKAKYIFLKRPISLDSNDVSIEEIIDSFLSISMKLD